VRVGEEGVASREREREREREKEGEGESGAQTYLERDEGGQ